VGHAKRLRVRVPRPGEENVQKQTIVTRVAHLHLGPSKPMAVVLQMVAMMEQNLNAKKH
jgi:hypothetical protein